MVSSKMSEVLLQDLSEKNKQSGHPPSEMAP